MLILASLSPRRRDLLKLITPDFSAVAPDADETLPDNAIPETAVEELAHRKALSVYSARRGDTVIGADTVVVLDGKILGKPADSNDALRMLTMLSGREHEVFTGVCVLSPHGEKLFHERTLVRFRDITPIEAKKYVATGEPLDKAGAYGIQGRAAIFVSGITGDFYNVVGLPLSALALALSEFGII